MMQRDPTTRVVPSRRALHIAQVLALGACRASTAGPAPTPPTQPRASAHAIETPQPTATATASIAPERPPTRAALEGGDDARAPEAAPAAPRDDGEARVEDCHARAPEGEACAHAGSTCNGAPSHCIGTGPQRRCSATQWNCRCVATPSPSQPRTRPRWTCQIQMHAAGPLPPPELA